MAVCAATVAVDSRNMTNVASLMVDLTDRVCHVVGTRDHVRGLTLGECTKRRNGQPPHQGHAP
jgi:hypothetical protein